MAQITRDPETSTLHSIIQDVTEISFKYLSGQYLQAPGAWNCGGYWFAVGVA